MPMYFAGAVLQGTHPRPSDVMIETSDCPSSIIPRTIPRTCDLDTTPLIQDAPPPAGGPAAASAGKRMLAEWPWLIITEPVVRDAQFGQRPSNRRRS